MPSSRHVLAAALAALASLLLCACSRDVGDTVTNAAMPDASDAPTTREVSPAAAPSVAEASAAGNPAAAPDPDADSARAGGCDADAVQTSIGQTATDEAIEAARTGSDAKTVRVLRPGQPATMDYRGDRLNILLDDAGLITSLHCG